MTASQFPICSDHPGINLRLKFFERPLRWRRPRSLLANSIYMCAADSSSSARSIIHEWEILLPRGESWRAGLSLRAGRRREKNSETEPVREHVSEPQHASFFGSASESILYRTAPNNRGHSSPASADAQPHAAEPLHAATQEVIDSGGERHQGLDSHEIPTMALFLSHLQYWSQPRRLGKFHTEQQKKKVPLQK